MSLTGIAFALVFAGAMLLALFRRPLYGLYAYVGVFYLHPPSRWWGESLPDLRWSLLAAAVTFIATLRMPKDPTRPSWISTPPARLLLAYTVWLWVQNIWALSPDDQMTISILYTKYVVLFYLIYRLLDTPETTRRVLVAHILGCAYLGWLAYNARVSGRLEGIGGPGIDEANALAMQMGTGVMVAAMLILGGRGWIRWTAFLSMPFLLNTMVLAGSRGAFVALLGAGVALWYLKPEKHRSAFYAYAVLGAALFLMLANQIFWGRVDTITAVTQEDATVDRSAESRLVLFAAQWEMAKRYPLGAGHRGTAVLSPQYLDPMYLSRSYVGGHTVIGQRSSHNTFMTALVEQGIPGAVLYLFLWWWVCKTLVEMRKLQRQADLAEHAVLAAGVGGALALVFFAGQFVDYIKAEVQVWLVVVLAVLLHLERKRVAELADKSSIPQAKIVSAGVALPSASGK
jgi:O-antigen ligase